MNYRSFSDLRHLIVKSIPKLQFQNFDLIVGIPRSGMVPAYIIALYLNKKCCDIDSLINNATLRTGSTRRAKNLIMNSHEAKKILLVDDSIDSGVSLTNELQKLPQ